MYFCVASSWNFKTKARNDTTLPVLKTLAFFDKNVFIEENCFFVNFYKELISWLHWAKLFTDYQRYKLSTADFKHFNILPKTHCQGRTGGTGKRSACRPSSGRWAPDLPASTRRRTPRWSRSCRPPPSRTRPTSCKRCCTRCLWSYFQRNLWTVSSMEQ